jgi:hypothetical protein
MLVSCRAGLREHCIDRYVTEGVTTSGSQKDKQDTTDEA